MTGNGAGDWLIVVRARDFAAAMLMLKMTLFAVMLAWSTDG